MKTTQETIKQAIAKGKTSLGIELGSTRIKAVLIDENFETIASGSYEWENLLEDGFGRTTYLILLQVCKVLTVK